jgi:hypothetical protein
MMSDRVYNGIADGAPMSTVVGHGQTYSAHPVSAAVALEVLRLYEEGGLLETAGAWNRSSPAACAPCSTIRWWAMPAAVACWVRWNWWPTSRPRPALRQS